MSRYVLGLWSTSGIELNGNITFTSLPIRHFCVALRPTKLNKQNIPRCNALLASTLSLALTLPNDSITLLRARASQLEFSLLPPSDPNDIDEEPQADPDVLPTLLAYKDGKLQKTWIRVDWEIKDDGVEGLLKRYVLVFFMSLPFPFCLLRSIVDGQCKDTVGSERSWARQGRRGRRMSSTPQADVRELICTL